MRYQIYKKITNYFGKCLPSLLGIFISLMSYSQSTTAVSLSEHNGKVSKQDLENDTSRTAWFQTEFMAYRPEVTEAQKKILTTREFQVVIILGTWCSDSRMQVPRLYKVFYELGLNPPITLITTDKNKKVIEPGFVHITAKYVPYFIIRDKNGKDIGEIIETPKKSLEADLAAILKKIRPTKK